MLNALIEKLYAHTHITQFNLYTIHCTVNFCNGRTHDRALHSKPMGALIVDLAAFRIE